MVGRGRVQDRFLAELPVMATSSAPFSGHQKCHRGPEWSSAAQDATASLNTMSSEAGPHPSPWRAVSSPLRALSDWTRRRNACGLRRSQPATRPRACGDRGWSATAVMNERSGVRRSSRSAVNHRWLMRHRRPGRRPGSIVLGPGPGKDHAAGQQSRGDGDRRACPMPPGVQLRRNQQLRPLAHRETGRAAQLVPERVPAARWAPPRPWSRCRPLRSPNCPRPDLE